MNERRGPSAPRPVCPLYRRIWGAVNRIPSGRVATYGQIAALAGVAGQARLVGYALHRLPAGSPVPWHRVVDARGRISPRAGGDPEADRSLQRLLLEREAVGFDRDGTIDLDRFRWTPRRRVVRERERHG